MKILEILNDAQSCFIEESCFRMGQEFSNANFDSVSVMDHNGNYSNLYLIFEGTFDQSVVDKKLKELNLKESDE